MKIDCGKTNIVSALDRMYRLYVSPNFLL